MKKYRVIFIDSDKKEKYFEVYSKSFHIALSDFECMNIYKEIKSLSRVR